MAAAWLSVWAFVLSSIGSGEAWQASGSNSAFVRSEPPLAARSAVALLQRHGAIASPSNAATLTDAGAQRSKGLEAIVPDDFWALRDLLLTGYGAVFMKRGSEGQEEVKRATVDLVEMLPDIHPHPPCRTQIRTEVEAARAGAASSGWKAGMAAVAQAAWQCLPGHWSEEAFVDSLPKNLLDDEDGLYLRAFDARMPALKDESNLGACRGSQWPRACSYWATLHAMAYRADALQMGGRFLQAIVPILAGGATLCGGCTLHCAALHEPVLKPAVLQDRATFF
jgi:hypothetical protein